MGMKSITTLRYLNIFVSHIGNRDIIIQFVRYTELFGNRNNRSSNKNLEVQQKLTFFDPSSN